MPLFYLRRLTGRERTDRANRHLARYLAFVAGAANAGGWMAVRQYTSHMSGLVSSMADDVALGSFTLFWQGLAAVTAFFLGAISTTVCIRWARVRKLESEFALPLMIEAVLLVTFGLTARTFAGSRLMGTVLLLCFTMGLQNATITKLSGSVIRTTHLTGMITDIGIATGRILSASLGRDASIGAGHFSLEPEVRAIRLLGSLVALFFVGAVTGAVGFKHVGALFALPLALILVLLAAMPVFDDVRRFSRAIATT
jgi:uncharacterized membrane protein YoaK (UPF0700 family)